MTLTVDNVLALTPAGGGPIDDWFCDRLEDNIKSGLYLDAAKMDTVIESIVTSLMEYKDTHGIEDIVIGMSGGVDSALTAALFKQAGWITHGVTLPIHQKPEETSRGQEAIDVLRLEPHSFDLTAQFDSMQDYLGEFDSTYRGLQRQGNLRARLRMMTLYNLAHKVGGCVGSTDNFSELAAGFWTLHGDVGDIAPIQSLSKSWEVPYMASKLGVPLATVNATPTDGLGISNGDADQLGMSYLEFDILLFDILNLPNLSRETIQDYINTITNEDIQNKAGLVLSRIASTSFKRNNPFNLTHPLFEDRFDTLTQLDRSL